MSEIENDLKEIVDCIQYYHNREPESSRDARKKGLVDKVAKLEYLLLSKIFTSIHTITSKKMLSDLFSNFGFTSSYGKHGKGKSASDRFELWDEFLKFMFMGAFYLSKREYGLGTICLTKAMERFCNKVWDREAFKVIVFKDFLLQLCKLCVTSAKEADAKGDPFVNDCKDTLATALMNLRNRTGMDREDDKRISKKIVILRILNYQFLLYFKIDNINMCENIMKSVKEGRLFYPFEYSDYSKADRVTFDYYSGRVSYFTSEYKEASESFMKAFRETSFHYYHNKRLILKNLICVNLMLGRYPPISILRKYGMLSYEPLIRSCACGKLRAFFRELERNQIAWLKNDTYLLLERSKIVAYRNFFRKVCTILFDEYQNRFPLDVFLTALRIEGINMSLLGLEGLLSTLIFQGYICGYISHKHQTVVLAKTLKDTFPPIVNQYKKFIS